MGPYKPVRHVPPLWQGLEAHTSPLAGAGAPEDHDDHDAHEDHEEEGLEEESE